MVCVRTERLSERGRSEPGLQRAARLRRVQPSLLDLHRIPRLQRDTVPEGVLVVALSVEGDERHAPVYGSKVRVGLFRTAESVGARGVCTFGLRELRDALPKGVRRT